MGKYKQTNDKDFISIEKALDMIEPFNKYAHYDKDQEEKEDMPATFNGSEENTLVSLILNASPVQGSVAPPSKSTKNKYYSQARKKLSRKEDGLHVSGEFFPLTIGWEDTLQYDSNLHPVTDYHEAMMDNIKKMHGGKPIRVYNRLEKFAIKVANEVKDYYGLNGKALEDQVRELRNCKEIDSKIAYDVLTVEGILEEFLPDEIYPIITGRSRKTVFKIYEEGRNLREKLIEKFKRETNQEKKREIFKELNSIPSFNKRLSTVLADRLNDIDLGKIT